MARMTTMRAAFERARVEKGRENSPLVQRIVAIMARGAGVRYPRAKRS